MKNKTVPIFLKQIDRVKTVKLIDKGIYLIHKEKVIVPDSLMKIWLVQAMMKSPIMMKNQMMIRV